MPDHTDWDKLPFDEPFIRDVMAIERTIMANERTFLSFWRTALTMFIAGLTFIQFFAGTVFQVIGWVFIPTGLAVFIQGVRVYQRMCKAIRLAEQTVENESRKNQVARA
jgi:putative membrane protein